MQRQMDKRDIACNTTWKRKTGRHEQAWDEVDNNIEKKNLKIKKKMRNVENKYKRRKIVPAVKSLYIFWSFLLVLVWVYYQPEIGLTFDSYCNHNIRL